VLQNLAEADTHLQQGSWKPLLALATGMPTHTRCSNGVQCINRYATSRIKPIDISNRHTCHELGDLGGQVTHASSKQIMYEHLLRRSYEATIAANSDSDSFTGLSERGADLSQSIRQACLPTCLNNIWARAALNADTVWLID
jgi:hypothetical protein